MENASKALFMAAGVLLGILLLSVMIYVFRQGSRVNQTYDQKQITNQLELYNSQFEHYDRDNNNVMEVISLANLAFDVNIDTDYDSTNAVQIEVIIGGKKFIIPNSYCPNCNDSANVNMRDKKCKTCGKDLFMERNKIVIDSSKTQMSIYDLANLSLKNLSIASVAQKHNLFPGLEIKTISVDLENDNLSTTKLKDGKTIYKYLFAITKPEDFEYHVENMKVSKIKLTAYCNPDW